MTAPMPFVSYERARVLDDVNFELLRHGDPPSPCLPRAKRLTCAGFHHNRLTGLVPFGSLEQGGSQDRQSADTLLRGLQFMDPAEPYSVSCISFDWAMTTNASGMKFFDGRLHVTLSAEPFELSNDLRPKEQDDTSNLEAQEPDYCRGQ